MSSFGKWIIMKIKTSELIHVCGPTSRFPEIEETEIAFAGRSNVGKSSLINSLLNRKNLARTSSSPGKTVTINFYLINNEFYLVDLPGYGYAKASETERAKWGKMIEKYLKTRENLKLIVLLIDIRHAPTKDDIMMYDFIVASGFQPVIVATKLDKIKRSQRDKQLKLIRETLKAPKDTVIIPHSALDKSGRDEILDYLERYL